MLAVCVIYGGKPRRSCNLISKLNTYNKMKGKVAGSKPDELNVFFFFSLAIPSGRTLCGVCGRLSICLFISPVRLFECPISRCVVYAVACLFVYLFPPLDSCSAPFHIVCCMRSTVYLSIYFPH
jgi:hypothetical protein